MGIRIGEATGEEHLVGREAGTRHSVVRLEGRLLHLGVVVADVAIQRETSHLDQWVVAVRPDLRQIEGIEAVGLGGIERHDLHVERPARELLVLDRLVEVALVVVGIPAGDPVGLGLGQALDALVALEVVFHPEATRPRAFTHM